MRFTTLRWRRIVWEFFFPAVLCLLAWHVGMRQLEDWRGPAASLTNDLFIPAIAMNAGQGFRNLDPAEIPELRAFLDFRAQDFDVALISDDITFIPLHPYQEFHRYLIYAAAASWRLFGLSWDGLKYGIVFLFCLAALAVYGICRLAMSGLLAVLAAAAFLHAPPVLWTLPLLRDFAKAPFILGVLFLLGLLVRFKPSTRHLLGIAGALGLMLGIGMGFRRDMMVFVPISAAMLWLVPLRPPGWGIQARLAATALLLACFLLFGWPIHQSLRAHGFVAAHDTIMGFASFSDHELGVIRHASYEKHYLLNDLFCTLRAHDAARRGVTVSAARYDAFANLPEFDIEMKRAYVLEMVKTFPADMLTRAYAAVLRIATGTVTTLAVPTRTFERYGLWFAALGLLLIAGVRPYRAWLALLLLCYFCGITSLQFAFRHVFHMSFVPYFFAGLTLNVFGVWAIDKWKARLKPPPAAASDGSSVSFSRRLCQAIVWAAIMATLFCLPLAAARIWQGRTVAAMREAYTRAESTPVSHTTLSWDGRTLFVPREGTPCSPCHAMGLIVDIQSRLLSASFAQVGEPLDLSVVYEWEGVSWDFSAPLAFSMGDIKAPENLRYFLPVHETTACTDWNRFVGLSLPDRQAHLFKGFHQVNDIHELGLLINMVVPDDETLFIDAQHLEIPWFDAPWRSYVIYEDFHPFVREMEVRAMLAEGRSDEAIATTLDALERRPFSIQFTFLLAEALDQVGRVEEAVNHCRDLFDVFETSFVLHARMDRYLNERGGAPRRVAWWAERTAQRPESACAAAYLERARQALKDTPDL